MILLLSGCLGPAAPVPLADLPPVELPAELQATREALREVEIERLQAALSAATDPRAKAELLVEGRSLAPEIFGPELERLAADLSTRDDDVDAARAAAALYDGAADAQERRHWRAFTDRTLARWRYTPSERATTAAEQEGITRAMVYRALETVQTVHVAPPETAALLQPGFSRLTDLGMVEGLASPTSDLRASVDRALDAAVAHGTPETAASAELVEAVFGALDPWTAPVWPKQVAAWEDRHDGVVPGVVGVQLEDTEAGVLVRRVVEASPAWAADLHLGDQLVSVDGEPVVDAAQAAARLRGEDGTSVELGLVRADTDLQKTLTRASVPQTTVMGWKRAGAGWDVWVEPGIALIRIGAFRPRTAAAFATLLPSRASLRGLILDLRGNAGGDLDAALTIADQFVSSGPLVQVEARIEVDRDPTWGQARPGAPWEGLPIVVLVDGGTASSAEILAGALQADGARVIGSRTTGKGTGQLLRVDEELGFAMQITHLRWRLPDGTLLHRTDDATDWGIHPDDVDPLGPTERFLVGVLQARREALAVHADGSPMPYSGPEADPDLPPLGRDPHVVRALALLRTATTGR